MMPMGSWSCGLTTTSPPVDLLERLPCGRRVWQVPEEACYRITTHLDVYNLALAIVDLLKLRPAELVYGYQASSLDISDLSPRQQQLALDNQLYDAFWRITAEGQWPALLEELRQEDEELCSVLNLMLLPADSRCDVDQLIAHPAFDSECQCVCVWWCAARFCPAGHTHCCCTCDCVACLSALSACLPDHGGHPATACLTQP